MPEYHQYEPILALKEKIGIQEVIDKFKSDGWAVGGIRYELVSICDECKKKIQQVPIIKGDKCYHKKCIKK